MAYADKIQGSLRCASVEMTAKNKQQQEQICHRIYEKDLVQSLKTKQKEAIRSAFMLEDRPLSPEETLNYAQEQVEGIRIATIYRNIHSLVEESWLMPVELPGESTRI